MRRRQIHPTELRTTTRSDSVGPEKQSSAAAIQPSDSRPDRAAGSVLLAHALLVVAFSIAASGLPMVRQLFDNSTFPGAVANVLLNQGAFVLFPTLLAIWLHQVPPVSVTGAQARPGSLILALLVGVPAAVVFSGLNNLLLFSLAPTGFVPAVGQLAAFDIQAFDRSVPELLLIAFVSILLPAVSEELMFRGLLQGSLFMRAGEGSTILLQAIAFMLYHGNPAFLLPPLLAGLLLGLVRSRSGSLLPAIAAHLSLNTSLTLIHTYLPRFTSQLIDPSTLPGRSLLYASLIATCLAAVALVPLVILIAGNPPDNWRAKSRRRFPADLKFMLATLLMLVTIFFEYYRS